MCRWAVKKHPETGRRTKKPMLLRERGIIARDLHRNFYTALAAGDIAKIADLACKGLVQSSQRQIQLRKAANKPPQKFSIEKYNGWNSPPWLAWPFTLLPFQSTRVLTDRLVPIPVGKDSWIRQCVVRIKTTQTLDRGTGKSPQTKPLTEHVVIQKLSINGQEQPWKIWGTVQPSTSFQILEMHDGKSSPVSTYWDTFKEKLSGMTGGVM